jgi:hypothetical protein
VSRPALHARFQCRNRLAVWLCRRYKVDMANAAPGFHLKDQPMDDGRVTDRREPAPVPDIHVARAETGIGAVTRTGIRVVGRFPAWHIAGMSGPSAAFDPTASTRAFDRSGRVVRADSPRAADALTAGSRGRTRELAGSSRLPEVPALAPDQALSEGFRASIVRLACPILRSVGRSTRARQRRKPARPSGTVVTMRERHSPQDGGRRGARSIRKPQNGCGPATHAGAVAAVGVRFRRAARRDRRRAVHGAGSAMIVPKCPDRRIDETARSTSDRHGPFGLALATCKEGQP